MKIITEKPTILSRAIPLISSVAITGGLFVTLPLMQWASDLRQNPDQANLTTIAVAVPPAPPELPPPPEEEIEEEEIELEAEVQRISLDQINMALNAGMGGMSAGSLTTQSFQLPDNLDDMVFEIADLDEKPEPLYRIAPKYPFNLKRSGIQGRVFLLFVVNEDGIVENARVTESPHPEFSKAALDAIKIWKFHPGKKGGKPVKTRIRIPLAFSLRG
ncbi:energy transducer TonB [Opitutia bacterium ISCC 51]|nr:energy transducer TonB [Opitutae bacterium ISCC 51]QXD27256.1 energy transducer TonB [Opitutae bacterium ISCC 52]